MTAKCPNCGHLVETDNRKLTDGGIVEILKHYPVKYSEPTYILISRLFKLTPTATTKDFYRFLSKVRDKTDDQVRHGLQLFFQREFHLRGYEHQYASGMIIRENTFKEAQEQIKLPPIPKDYKVRE